MTALVWLRVLTAAASSGDNPMWTLVAAAIPALLTLAGTVWQVYARRPLSVSQVESAGANVRVLKLMTSRPASTVHPWFARAMVIWHLGVAAILLLLSLQPFGFLPAVSLSFLVPLAGLYLLGAAFYGVKYRDVRGTNPSAFAEIVVEAEPHALFDRCRSSLKNAGINLVSFDYRDPSDATAEAQVGGARLQVTIVRVEARRADPAESARPAEADRYHVHVCGEPTRRGDGLPRAVQCLDAFLRGFCA